VPTEGPLLGLLLALSFFMSVFWIWLVANIMIDLLKIMGLLTGMPTTFLGLTVLAWGNSTGDFMANTSIARKGFVEMAMTGCFASPLFNILLGLGISTLKCNLNVPSGIRFSYKDYYSAVPETLIIGTIIGLLFSIIMTAVNNNTMTKLQAKI
jgi:Ca2+/Na+ antiporter